MKKKLINKMTITIAILVMTIFAILVFFFKTTIHAGIEYYMHTEKYDAFATYYAEKYKMGDTEDIKEYHDGLWTCVYYDECGRMKLLIKISETDLHNEQGDYRVLFLEYIEDEYSDQSDNTTKIPFTDNWYSHVYVGPIG
ncbi:MAG: hypothetical protein IJB68_10905 [Ruminococcus sp.]|nr:hypothetical protein [Ruminococcus sp.]